MDFGISKNVKYIPHLDEIPINPYRLREILAEIEEYNKRCREYRLTDTVGETIPEKYRGRNRYWAIASEGFDDRYGEYPIISIYELQPGNDEDKILICKYRPERPEQKTISGTILEAVPLQTVAQAEKQILAARLEAERQERMRKKDPRLVNEIKIKIPRLVAPSVARREIDEKYSQEEAQD